MKNLGFCLTIMFAALFVSAPVLAHHGETNYDTEKLVTIKATVSRHLKCNRRVQRRAI